MAAAAHCRVVRVCSSAIASRKAIATQKERDHHDLRHCPRLDLVRAHRR